MGNKPGYRATETEHDISSTVTELDTTWGSSDTESESESDSESDNEFSPSAYKFNLVALRSRSGVPPSRKRVAGKAKCEKSSPQIESGLSATEQPGINKRGEMNGVSKMLESIPSRKVGIDKTRHEKFFSNIKASMATGGHQYMETKGGLEATRKVRGSRYSPSKKAHIDRMADLFSITRPRTSGSHFLRVQQLPTASILPMYSSSSWRIRRYSVLTTHLSVTASWPDSVRPNLSNRDRTDPSPFLALSRHPRYRSPGCTGSRNKGLTLRKADALFAATQAYLGLRPWGVGER
ncbi:hypothetical protein B0T19DRAFT_276701 [Cercophora scortea]|uniref:Uncharacterized protein n=1 Tax=Cercophora scortea TaxID=314031 RepID=A0AAE0I804_9PEZI|nr:hypothetical protein B0T19DRAFT_276701 [Cercophora scortea]